MNAMSMNYQERSEFARLQRADIESGKRIAQLIAQRDEALAMVEQLTRVARLAVKLRSLVPTELWIALAHEVDDACDAGVLGRES